jgi:hypothetical protein
MIDLYSLKPNPSNPRTITEQDFNALKDDLMENIDGLTASKIAYRDGIIVAGNQRYRALTELKAGGKIKEFDPEWFKDVSGWTDDQIRKWIITTNTSRGKWDFDMLASGDWEAPELAAWGVIKEDWAKTETTNENPSDAAKVEYSCPECGHTNTPSAFKSG